MRGLGRAYDVAPIASGQYISMRQCSAVAFICTGADTFTVREAKTSSGGSVQNLGNVISQYYQNTATNGTAGWTTVTQAAGFAVTQAGAYTTVIEVLAPMLDDGFDYVYCHAASAGLVIALPHDLTVQRKPDNLTILVA
jgi:hypothetical protein